VSGLSKSRLRAASFASLAAGQALDLLTSWTSSQRELERVFKAAMERRAFGLQRRVGVASAFGFGGPALDTWADPRFGVGPGYGGFGGWWPGYASGAAHGSRLYSDLDLVLNAATSTLRGFAQPPGRKVMVVATLMTGLAASQPGE
jgi:hypothetical protein